MGPIEEQTSEAPPGTSPRLRLSHLASTRRQELGLSLRQVVERTVDPATGKAAFNKDWLSRVEKAADNLFTPQEDVLRALATALELPYVEVAAAMNAQFYGIQWVYSEDRTVRTLVVQSDPVSPDQVRDLRALMDRYMPPES